MAQGQFRKMIPLKASNFLSVPDVPTDIKTRKLSRQWPEHVGFY